MKSQTIIREQTAQEYLTVGSVFLAGGVMFIAGSQQLRGATLWFVQIAVPVMIGLGSILMGVSIGMQRRASRVPVRAKTATKKRNATKK